MGLTLCALTANAVEFRYVDQIDRTVRQAITHRLSSGKLTALEAADSLKAWLGAEGYLDAQASVLSDTIQIVSGAPYRFNRIVLAPDSSDIRTYSGYFTKIALDRAVGDVVDEYVARGYYYARATVGEIERIGDAVNVTLQVNPGPLVTVVDLKFEGLTRTKPGILRDRLPIRAGDTLSDRLVADVERSAVAIRFADLTPPIVVQPRVGYTQADLILRMREKQQFMFSGGAGYINEGDGRIVWDLAFEIPNLFGEGKRIAAQSSRRETGRNQLRFEYQQPSTWLGRGEFDASLATRDYRDNFYEFSLFAGYAVEIARGTTVGSSLGWKRVEPTDSVGYSRFSVEVNITRRQTDSELNPSTGYHLSTAVTYGYRKYSRDSLLAGRSFNDTRATLSFTRYQPLIRGIVAVASIGYRGVESSGQFLPLSELHFIGGAGSLRGFRNEQFAAQRAALGTIEPRIRFTVGYLFGFYDAAFMQLPLYNNNRASLDEEFETGFGGGLALVTRDRSVKLSLGWNKALQADQPYLSVEFLSGL